MSSSSVIGNMQSALDCAGKCDCCDKLQSQINAINAKIAGLKNVDENRIIQTTKAALQPDIATAVAGGVAVVTSRLQPQIDNGINKAREALNKAFQVETFANNAQREAISASADAARARRDAAEAERLARTAKSTADVAEATGQGATRSAGEAKRIGNNAIDEAAQARRKAELIEKQAQQAFARLNNVEDIATIARRESELAKGLANQAKGTAGTAITNAAKASRDALDASGIANAAKGLADGIGKQVNNLGNAISKLESSVGNALSKAAQAIGISQEALSATAKLGGQVLQIFNIIGTIFSILDGMATREALGNRIDALEAMVVAIGNDLSRLLGKLLGIQNRIGANESAINAVRNIANNAISLSSAAMSAASSAQSMASSASGQASTAQSTATQAQNIGEQAKTFAVQALQKAGEGIALGLTAIALYQTVKGLRGLQGIPGIPGIPGKQGERGLQGIPGRQGERGLQGAPGVPGIPGRDGITTVIQPGTPGRQGERGLPGISGLPGRPGRDGINGINGRDGKDGKDVNPGDLAGLRSLIVSQHTQTRANSAAQHGVTRTTILTPIMAALAPILALLKQIYDIVSKAASAAQLALLNIINSKLGNQVTGGISGLVTRIAENTYLEKALAVMTFAATIHNALMLSNNLGQTLIMIIDQVTGFLLPKGVDGTPINFGETLGKTVHLVIASAIGEENYTELTENWQKANRIYQATSNVFNQVTQLGGLITSGLEVIAGNVGKIGNALRKGGVLLENAYNYMNPQPNLQGKFFSFMNTSNEKLNSIAAVVAIPIAFKEVLGGINSSTADLKREISQTDPKDANGNPIKDAEGKIIHYKPGLEVPTPIVEEAKGEQSKADSTNFIELVIEDIFDGGD